MHLLQPLGKEAVGSPKQKVCLKPDIQELFDHQPKLAQNQGDIVDPTKPVCLICPVAEMNNDICIFKQFYLQPQKHQSQQYQDTS